MLDVAENRLSKSLDVVTFIRDQIMMVSYLNSMLTTQEKILAKNQYKFALTSDED